MGSLIFEKPIRLCKGSRGNPLTSTDEMSVRTQDVCVCVCVYVVCICDVPSRLRGIEINSIRVAYMRARFFLTKDPTKAKRTFALLPIQACSGVLYRAAV